MARHACKGICVSWPGMISAPNGGGVRYVDGDAFCKVCESKIQNNTWARCPCCGTILRTNKRNKPTLEMRGAPSC